MSKPSPSPPTPQAVVTSTLQAALKAHESGRIPEAITGYRNVLRLAPKNFDALHLLGVAFTQSGSAAEGVPLLRQALSINPNSAACRVNLANALLSLSVWAEAASLFQMVLNRGGPHEAAFRGLAQCLNELARPKDVLAMMPLALKHFPKSAGLHNESGRARGSLGQMREAAADYRKAVDIEPRYHVAACNLGNALTELKAFDEAEAVLNRVLAAEPGNLQALNNLAQMYRSNWQADRALAVTDRALAFAPGDAGFRNFRAGCLIDLGRNSEAEEIYRDVLKGKDKLQDAVIGLSQIQKFKSGDPAITIVEGLLSDPALAPKDRKPLLFAKSKIEDDLGHAGAAVEAAIAAKAIEPFPDMFGNYQAYMRRIMALMDGDFFRARRAQANKTSQPVFILGMPRSGTTLTEQIIASHPQADGAGELTEFPAVAEAVGFRQLAPEELVARLTKTSATVTDLLANRYLAVLRRDRKPDALRITDKLPHNFENIWLIALLFPNARIIHCVRNPVDICISIFLRNFSEGHWYTRDLATLGKYYNLYKEMIAHWRAVTGLQWFDSDYETLVADPEPSIRAMISFLDLPWDDRCLEHTATERSVHTFSKWQVRQPIYTSSVERWRKYQDHIGPLLQELGIAPGKS